MGGRSAVARDHRPIVFEHLDVVCSGVYHRLDGDRHARFQPHAPSGSPVVGDGGIFVHIRADAVSHQGAHHGESVRLGVRLDSPTQIAQPRAVFEDLYPLEERLLCHFHELFLFLAHLSYHEGARRVAVIAHIYRAYVHADDVAFPDEALGRGNAVHHFLVYRHACRGGKTVISQKGRSCPARGYVVIDELIHLRGGHARFYLFSDKFERVAHDGVSLAHQLDLVSGLNADHRSPRKQA